MAKLGSKARPVIVRVQDEERVEEIVSICLKHGLQYILGIEPEKPENLHDLKKALKTVRPPISSQPLKVSPNDYCPCGSNKKVKNCCAFKQNNSVKTHA